MITRTYKAGSLSEAVALIKKEMGPHAKIISSRSVPGKKTLFKEVPPQIYVEASVEEKHLTHEQLEIFKLISKDGKVIKPSQKNSQPAKKKGFLSLDWFGLSQKKAKPSQNTNSNLFKPSSGESLESFLQSNKSVFDAPKGQEAKETKASEFKEEDPIKKIISNNFAESLNAKFESLQSENEKLKEEIRNLKEQEAENFFLKKSIKVSELQNNLSNQEIGKNFKQELLDKLISRGVNSELLDSLQSWLTSNHIGNEKDALLEQSIEYFLEKFLAFEGGLPRYLSLIGPKHSGKTQSIMKLSEQFLEKGFSVAIMSLDTMSHVELDQYCLDKDIPFYVVRQTKAFDRAVIECQDVDYILIDSYSIEQDDRASIRRLKNRLTKMGSMNLLTLDASHTNMEFSLEAYKDLPINGFVMTHLDKAKQVGQVYNLIQSSKKPIFYFGIGTEIDDFEEATSERLASLLFDFELGNSQEQESLGTHEVNSTDKETIS